MKPSTLILHFLFFFFVSFTVLGQQDDPPIDEWVKALSVRKDNQSIRFRTVLRELTSYDSVVVCDALGILRSRGPEQNLHYRIRLVILQSQIEFYNKHCPGAEQSSAVLKEAMRSAYETGNDALILEIHRALAWAYTDERNFGSASLHAMMALDLADRIGNENVYVGFNGWYLLGYLLYNAREYEASVRASLKALDSSAAARCMVQDTLIPLDKMFAWNTVGLCYEKLGKPDSAFWAFDHSLTLARQLNNDFWKGLITGNKGDVFFQLGQYDSAAVMLRYDYRQSLASSQYDNAANSLQWLARIELSKGDATKALSMLREAGALLQKAPQRSYKVNILYGYMQVYEALGKPDSMKLYMHAFLSLHDSLELEASNHRLEVVRLRMENQTSIHEILSLHREKQKIKVIRNMSIALIVMLAALGFMVLNRQKLRLKLRQQEALEEKRMAEKEASLAREQLDLFTSHLREKTALLENLQSKLENRQINEAQYQQIAELSHFTILTDEDWDRFKGLFEKVYPGFFHSLKQRFADITLAEIRMAALSKLQVPSKEAANLLGISPNSVYKSRQRLRQRLGLDPDANLELYFSSQESV